MTDKVYGVDFTNETAPTGSMTISIHNGTALRDVLLSDLVKAIPSLRTISASAPTVDDDENAGDGYKRGDMWLDTSTGTVYMAWVVTAGAAGWLQISNNVQDDLDGISSTQGAILYRNANDWVALSPGTSGQVLQSGGAGANPSWATSGGGSNSISDGRLTLETGVPVSTTSQTGKTTVYFTPYVGNKISLYNGSAWEVVEFTEKSVAVPSTTSTPFDIFAYNNAGTVTLETVNWTNDSTRATALVRQDGVLVKSGAATRRYLGTGRTTAVSGQCEDSDTKRFLWNMYNRVGRDLYKNDSTAHTYTGTANRAWNNDANIKVDFVLGQADAVPTNLSGMVRAGADSENAYITVGYDGSTLTDTQVGFVANSNAQYAGGMAGGYKPLAAGYHYVTALEAGGASGAGFTQVQLKVLVAG